MANKKKESTIDQRKKDHIDLALVSQVNALLADTRFYYEPMLSGHRKAEVESSLKLAGKQLMNPMWVSSMTGGTAFAGIINRRLAKACNEFGLGMGLGSCRILLENEKYLRDFDVRPIIGNEAPLFANLGIAQIEKYVINNEWDKIKRLTQQLKADGLIIHVNPLQEWLQPEGDIFQFKPIDSISIALEKLQMPIIVKEVGQGMGPQSLQALLELPLEAIEFGALGGTNFSNLEIKRTQQSSWDYKGLTQVGHTATEMVTFVNSILLNKKVKIKCKKIILSGGVKDFLDGYFLMKKIKLPAIYGQAAAFLKYATKDYDSLKSYIISQLNGLEVANNYLVVK